MRRWIFMAMITTNDVKPPKNSVPKRREKPITTEIILPKGISMDQPDPGPKKGKGFGEIITTENVEKHRKKYLDSQKMAKARAAKEKKK